jgi:flagellar FliJ protein
MVSAAEEITREKTAELADAAKRRRAVEMMAERHAETVRRHDLTVDQNNLDELAVTSKARNAARGLDGQTEERANLLRTGRGTAADREAAGRELIAGTARDGVPAAEALAARRADLRLDRRAEDHTDRDDRIGSRA